MNIFCQFIQVIFFFYIMIRCDRIVLSCFGNTYNIIHFAPVNAFFAIIQKAHFTGSYIIQFNQIRCTIESVIYRFLQIGILKLEMKIIANNIVQKNR